MRRIRDFLATWAATALCVLLGSASSFNLLTYTARAAPIFLDPAPYLAFDNTLPGAGSAISPFAGQTFDYFHLETFEDGLLNTPGVAANVGSVIGPIGITDSVDADDGSIDGLGGNGHSMFNAPGDAGIRYTFNAAQLGQLPTHVGIVWTDGATFNNVTLEAFDALGASLGTRTELNLGDGDFGSATAEDRFFGVVDLGGISAIRITSPGTPGSSGSGIEVDHLQYGLQAIPEPGGLALFAVAVAVWCVIARPRIVKTAWFGGLIVFAAIGAVVGLTLGGGQAHAAEAYFTGLGDLAGGVFESRAAGVSADGSVVVGTSSSGTGSQAFRWTQNTGMVGLGTTSSASDVSADGSVVVGYWGSQAMRWTQQAGLVGLGDLPGGLFSSYANAVSGDGSVVVGRGTTQHCARNGCANVFPPFRWTQASGMVRLSGSTAMDVSSNGTVIVGAWASQASRWTQETGLIGLGDLPGGAIGSQAFGVSADGSVIVGQGTSDAGVEAFRWTQATGMVGLGFLPGYDFSTAQDVSADGSIVVGSLGAGSATNAGAFIWDASNGMRRLSDILAIEFGLGASLAGWSLQSANAISADGQVVVGVGTNPGGNTEAWLARIPTSLDLPGDYNSDQVVDAGDYTVWRNSVGGTALDNRGPGITGPIGDADYNVWKMHYGDVLPAIGAGGLAAAHLAPGDSPGAKYLVPEPATLGCATSAFAAVLFSARCRRSGLCRPRGGALRAR